MADCRLELFFKSPAQLGNQIIPWLHQHAITSRINITNKAKEEPLLEYVAKLASKAPTPIDICCHYSFKYQNPPRAPPDACAHHMTTFLHGLQQQQSPQCTTSCLFVSGGGKSKPVFDTLRALEYIAAHGDAAGCPPIHVAFNPYFADVQARRQEGARLGAKLKTGVVAGVYLQMGSDVQALQEGLQECQQLMKMHCTEQGGVLPIHGSVFVPSKRLLAQMRFRPWNGVFLSDKYLSSVEDAMRITRDLLTVYAAHGVVPLVETAIRNEAELTTLKELLDCYTECCRRVVKC